MGAPLSLAPALAEYEAGGAPPVRVGLAGEHQRGNAALAVALAAAWEARAGAGAAPGQAAAPATAGPPPRPAADAAACAAPSGLGGGQSPAGPAARDGAAPDPPAEPGAAGRGDGRQGAEAGGHSGAAARAAAVAARRLPDEYLRGLAACRWPGRAQVRLCDGARPRRACCAVCRLRAGALAHDASPHARANSCAQNHNHIETKEHTCCAAGQPGYRASGARQAPCKCRRARRVPWCGATQVVHDLEGCADAPAPPENGAPAGAAPGAAAARAAGAPPRLSFYLDGAHTEESMATCAAWFAGAVGAAGPRPDRGQAGAAAVAAGGDVQRVLLFNCMPARPAPALGRADSDGVTLVPALSGSTCHPGLLREARTSAAPLSCSVAGIPMA